MDQTQTLLLLLHNARLLEKKVVYNCLFLETKFWQFLHLMCIAAGLPVHGVLALSRCHSLMSLILHLPLTCRCPLSSLACSKLVLTVLLLARSLGPGLVTGGR